MTMEPIDLMKTLSPLLPAWLPLAAATAQPVPRDLDPVVVGRSNPYPLRGGVVDVTVQDGMAYCAVERRPLKTGCQTSERTTTYLRICLEKNVARRWTARGAISEARPAPGF
jgi:hypothetical protein